MAGTLVKRGPRGIWHCVLPDPSSRSRQLWRTTRTTEKRKAERILLEWQNRLGVLETNGTTIREPRLGDFVAEWQRERVSVLKESTRHQYGCTASCVLNFFGQRATVRKAFTLSRTQAYVASMVSAGRKTSTIDLHLAVLSSLSRYAIDTGALDVNPVTKVKRPTRQRPVPQAYSPSEVQAIIAATPKSHRDLVEFLFLTGVRRSEAGSLTVGQCLPTRGLTSRRQPNCTEVLIDRRVWRGRTDTPKTGVRRVTLGEHCGAMLANRVVGLKPDELVFTSDTGGYIDWQRWTRDVWIPTLHRAGVTLHTVHICRSTAVTATLQAGVPVSVASRRFGMTPHTLLAHYASVLSEAEQQAAASAEDVLLGNSCAPSSHSAVA